MTYEELTFEEAKAFVEDFGAGYMFMARWSGEDAMHLVGKQETYELVGFGPEGEFTQDEYVSKETADRLAQETDIVFNEG
jgi:hypothetical protein